MSNNFFTKPASNPSPSQPPDSRQNLIDYARRKLGEPVIELNVDDDQIQDRLDDALQLYREFHYDGVERTYLRHQVTQDDIDNEFIPAPDPIQSVTRAFVFSGLFNNTIFNFPARFSISRLGSLGGFATRPFINLTSLDITKRWLELAQQLLNPEKPIRFNKVTNKIFIDMNWEEEIRPDEFLIFEVWVIVDPEKYNEAFNDAWLKAYFTALVKKQWAGNLSKYEGIQLPGGVTLNGAQLLGEAKEEIEKLETDLEEKWSLPPDFMVG